jgi:DNA processing protein
MEPDHLVYLCALSKVFAYHCSVGRQLLDAFGSPAAVFAAGWKGISATLHHAGVLLDELFAPGLLDWAADEVSWAAAEGIRLLSSDDPEYPRRLSTCLDAPLMLYCKGMADLNAGRALAVVGTRKATWCGRESCRRLVGRLADLNEKPLIVSGLALGIDGCAHAAALEAGLSTVGVLPCGLDEIYPRQHRELARRMLDQGGALVSDFARCTSPAAHTFLRRNRIIAGMADATLLAESFRKGGGLITASLAASYQREVFAVPGRLQDASFEGCNRLAARQEAVLVADEDTIPLAMGWISVRQQRERPSLYRSDDTPQRREVLRQLEARAPLSAEEVASLSRLDPNAVHLLLLELELEGRVVADGTKFFLSL